MLIRSRRLAVLMASSVALVVMAVPCGSLLAAADHSEHACCEKLADPADAQPPTGCQARCAAVGSVAVASAVFDPSVAASAVPTSSGTDSLTAAGHIPARASIPPVPPPLYLQHSTLLI